MCEVGAGLLLKKCGTWNFLGSESLGRHGPVRKRIFCKEGSFYKWRKKVDQFFVCGVLLSRADVSQTP